MGGFIAGTGQRWKATRYGDGGSRRGLVLFARDKTQQHTEMLAGATNSTDGRISAIPPRRQRTSNPHTQKKPQCFSACVCLFRRRQTEKTCSAFYQFVIQVGIQSDSGGER